MKGKLWTLIFLVVLPFMVFPSERPVERDSLSPLASYQWKMSTPEEQGIHSGVITHSFNEAEKLPFIHTLLVVRNGYLIGE